MKKEPQADYAAELEKAHDRWDYVYEYGTSDPFYADGFNLNCIRSHINYYRGKIEETMKPEDYPEIYYKSIPAEFNKNYMAQPDEIRAAAKKSLEAYKTNPDYQYILRRKGDFSPKTNKILCVEIIIGYAKGLERAIAENDLVSMRRHENNARYLKAFENCARKMCDMQAEAIQLTMFSSDADEPAESDDFEFYDDEIEECGGMNML